MATIKYLGQKQVSTLGGEIKIEEGRGRMVVYDGDRELTVVDRDGFTFDDGTVRRVRLGNSPARDRVNLWISRPNEDVITFLGG